jgi:hypothetical protein
LVYVNNFWVKIILMYHAPELITQACHLKCFYVFTVWVYKY